MALLPEDPIYLKKVVLLDDIENLRKTHLELNQIAVNTADEVKIILSGAAAPTLPSQYAAKNDPSEYNSLTKTIF